MHVPSLLERVRLTGLNEVYLVTRVNDAEEVADLIPLKYAPFTMESVPFATLEAIPGIFPPRLRPA